MQRRELVKAIGFGCVLACICVTAVVLLTIILAMINGGYVTIAVGPEGFVEVPLVIFTMIFALYFLYSVYRESGADRSRCRSDRREPSRPR